MYRLAIWTPLVIGPRGVQVLVKQVHFQIVGTIAHHHNVDVCTLSNSTATQFFEALDEMDTDVVVGRDNGDFRRLHSIGNWNVFCLRSGRSSL
jgi:hypothetical protein